MSLLESSSLSSIVSWLVRYMLLVQVSVFIKDNVNVHEVLTFAYSFADCSAFHDLKHVFEEGDQFLGTLEFLSRFLRHFLNRRHYHPLFLDLKYRCF